LSFAPIVVFVGWIEIGKEVVEMEREKGHVGTHRLAKARTHCKIVVVNIVAYAAEHDALASNLLPSLWKVDFIIGFLSRPAIESAVEKNRIFFNCVGEMITLQQPSNFLHRNSTSLLFRLN